MKHHLEKLPQKASTDNFRAVLTRQTPGGSKISLSWLLGTNYKETGESSLTGRLE